MTGAISNITLVDSGTAAVPVTTQGRIIMGAGNDLQIYHDGTNSYIDESGTGGLILKSNLVSIKDPTGLETMATFDDDGSVDLYHDNSKKFETTATGVDIAGVIKVSDGVDSSPSYTFTGDTNTGVFLAAANRVGISGGGVLGLTVDATDTVVEGNFTVGGDFISLSTTTATFGGKVSGSDPTVDIDFATKGYVDGEVDGKTLSYKDASATTYQMNLFSDKFQLAGGSNITTVALAVDASDIADVTFNLNNSIVLTGQVKADNFTTTAETATWVTTVLDGFTSITSTSFVGELTGNASTATALASTGAITLLGDTTGGPNTYTSGGAVNVTTAIADSVVYNKELQGFNIPGTNPGAVGNGDSILEALERLQGQITTLPQGLVYQGIWSAVPGATGGGTPDLTDTTYQVNGHFYICDTAGVATPNGTGTTPNDWDVRDWVIFADDGAGGGVDEWQKIDNSSLAGGSGTTNTITKWTNNQTIGNSTITDDGSTVTIANTVDFITKGNNTFGNASADVSSFLGNVTLNENLILTKGLSIPSFADPYGVSGQVLTSGGGVDVANTWTTPTTGTVTSVGLTETGDALTITGSPVTSSGTINIAGAGASTQYINGELNLVAFPTLDNYQYWVLSDGTNTTNISTTDTATFASGIGIVNTEASGTVTTALRYVDATSPATEKNAIEAVATETPATGDFLWFSDISPTDNIIKKATIADIVDLGNETLAQVLANGNTSGANDIVMADSQKVTFGANPDLQIYHSTDSFIQTLTSGSGDFYIGSQVTGKDLKISSSNDITMETAVGGDGIKILGAGAVELYYNGGKNFETTSAGVSVTGSVSATKSGTAGIFNSGSTNVVASFTSTDGTGVIQCVDNAGNVEFGAAGDCFVVQPAGGTAQLTVCSTSSTFAGDVQIDGDLTVDGSIIHGGGGGGTAKGGTFTNLFTTQTGARTAFTISRATSGAMAFDVWLTSDTSATTSVAKKFTIVKSHATAPIVYKILDTGPDGATIDFTVDFSVGANDLTCLCEITPVTTTVQKIGITIDLGFGQYDATVVMPAT
jgi:hypothetical protein